MAVLKIKNELGQWVNIPSIKGEPGVEVSTSEPTNPDIKVWINPNGTKPLMASQEWVNQQINALNLGTQVTYQYNEADKSLNIVPKGV